MRDNEILYYINDINDLVIPKNMEQYNYIRLHKIPDDYNMINDFLKHMNRKLTFNEWIKNSNNEEDEIVYYGMFLNNKMVTSGAIERYTTDKWETSDIRTERNERGNGYASQIVYYITKKILEYSKIATIRTMEDNIAMTKIINNMGFKIL